MFNGMLDGIGRILDLMMILLIFFFPLGLWKLIDIIVWLFKHITIT